MHRLVAAGSEESPLGLRDLEHPPDLFVDGELRDTPAVAVVGSRKATRYGLAIADQFGGALARSGWTTVSGLARGVDTAAHRGCLSNQGHAVGVLGTGIDVRYPRSSAALHEDVLDAGGALVSEYPPGTPPDRWRFPARNRIMAAISAAIVVVEAARVGGALITARVGAEMGRAVFAVPGDVDRVTSIGCNLLIRDGACPVLGPEDLISELSLVLGPPPTHGSAAPEDIPATGMAIEDLAVSWGVSIERALARVGRLEVEGRLRRDGDWVMRA